MQFQTKSQQAFFAKFDKYRFYTLFGNVKKPRVAKQF